MSRSLLARALFALALAAALGAATAAPATAEPKHAIAMHGEPQYGPKFTHFDYVNPTAPKGGALRLAPIGTYSSFNPYIIKGVAAAGANIIYEQLLEGSSDEA